MRILYCLFVLLLLNSMLTYGQETSSSEIIKKGVELYDNEEYDAAIETFLTIHENDSNYLYMQSELALCYWRTGKYPELFALGENALKESSGFSPHLLNILANGYDDDGNPLKAIDCYKQSLALAPYNGLTHYNLGITYMNMGVLDSAQTCFQNAIKSNPFHPSSHLALGKLSARQGFYTKALLSLETFLLLEPQSSRSNENLIYLENMANNFVDPAMGEPVDPFSDNAGYEYSDHLIRAKVVLSEDFESEIDFNAALIKQTEMLYEIGLFNNPSDEFWSKTYFPFFKAVRENGFFEQMIYYLLLSTNNENVLSWVEKNQDSRNEFFQLGTYLNNIRLAWDIEVEGKIQKLSCNFYDSGNIFSLGNLNENELEEGYWIYFYETGIKSGEGYLNNGELAGEWKYYSEGGELSSRESYRQGKLSGPTSVYYKNGTLKSEAEFKDDMIIGTTISYYPCGQLEEETDYGYENGVITGYSLYPGGDSLSVYEGRNSLLHGKYLNYYPDGKLSAVYYYNDGSLDGEYVEYSDNGKILIEGRYSNDKKTGTWKEYYIDGNISTIATFKDGIEVGEKTSYFKDGKIAAITRMDEQGNFNGDSEFYGTDGILRCKELWVDGRLTKVTSFGLNNRIVHEVGAEDGNFTYVFKNNYGKTITRGDVIEGKKTGTWIDLWINGNKRREYNLKENKLFGLSTSYYQNGNIKDTNHFLNDTLTGESTEYYINGEISESYSTVNGNISGRYISYNPDGSVSSENYIVNGALNGWQKKVGRGGKPIYKNKYADALMIFQYKFDSSGVEIDQLDFRSDSRYVTHNGDGSIESESEMLCRQLHGTHSWYYPDGKVSYTNTLEYGSSNGKTIGYHRNGQKRLEYDSKQNLTHGTYYVYYDDGSVSSNSSYYLDMKDGKWVFYYPNGSVSKTMSYIDDLLHGNIDYFDAEGEFAARLIYQYDELIAYQYGNIDDLKDTIWIDNPDMKINTYYSNGEPALSLKLKDYMPHGIKKLMASNGKPLFSQNYYADTPSGPSVNYHHLSGKPFEEEEYFMGNKCGVSKKYRADGTIESLMNYWMDDLYGKSIFYNERGDVDKTEIYWGDSYYGSENK